MAYTGGESGTRFAIVLLQETKSMSPVDKEKKTKSRPVVLLKDLAPRKPIKGGSGKVLFGQSVPPDDVSGGAKSHKKGNK